MGQVGGIDGAYVATGHNCWGILNAPASGEAMAELIADGAARSTDLTPFDPARLPVLAADKQQVVIDIDRRNRRHPDHSMSASLSFLR